MNKKKIIIVASIIAVLLIGGFTYAYFTWKSAGTIVDGNLTCFEVEYTKGSDIGSDQNASILYLSSTYEDGLSTTFEVNLNRDCNIGNGLGTVYLDTDDNVDSSILENEILNYVVLVSDKKVSEGTINSTEKIAIYYPLNISYEPVEVKVIVWANGENVTNDNYEELSELIYKGKVSLEINSVPKQSAASFITNLYTNATKKIVTNNSIEYNTAPSVGLMNDRLGGTTDYDAGNIRYYGASPNNYVWLGDTYTEDMTIERGISEYGSFEECMENENSLVYCQEDIEVHAGDKKLWRIIGVFDGKLKLVTDNIISTQGLSWDTSDSSVNNGYGINEWSQSDLMKLLNPGYEDESINNSLYWTKGSGTVYKGSNNSTTPNVSFTNTGLSEDEKNMIEEVTWYTGAYNNISYADVHYKAEREDMGKICTSGTYCNDTVTRTKEWSGKVGLISASDYGYSVDLNSCNYTLEEYWQDDCALNNWLVNGRWYWTMSPRANSTSARDVFSVNYYGYFYNYSAYCDASVRPAVYLKSGVTISSGNGSGSDPYELSY